MHATMTSFITGVVCAGLIAGCTKPEPESETPEADPKAQVAKVDEKGAAEKATAEDTPAAAAAAVDPWALPPAPPKNVYNGPLFAMSRDYPDPPATAPANLPWHVALGNAQITTQNAAKYAAAAKAYVAQQGMKTLLFDYPQWDAAQAGWYNVPWLTNVREPILGTYLGSTFPPEMFPQSGLKTTMSTLVLVYYDKVAAGVAQKLWGKSGMNPVPGMKSGGAQYAEGSVIVKAAYSTAGAQDWPPMAGAQVQQVYANIDGDMHQNPKLLDVSLFQFDIIVKDSQSSPKSQWVFMTLVYDPSVQSNDPWDKLVPLGVMWGNDPGINSPVDCDPLKPGSCPALSENWINPAAPLYSKETLGWGGRMSGPNDGAVNLNNAIQKADGTIVPFDGRLAMSSCMGCHGSAEYEQGDFLLPAVNHCDAATDRCAPVLADCTGNTCKVTNNPGPTSRMVFHAPGGKDWSRWFQSRPGNVAQNPPAIALDYGMNNAFKALPTWFNETGQGAKNKFASKLADYRGVPRALLKRK